MGKIRCGIIGYGKVGLSLLECFAQQKKLFYFFLEQRLNVPIKEVEIWVYDKRTLTSNEKETIQKNHAHIFDKSLEAFFAFCTILFPSPGVDISSYISSNTIIGSEADLFFYLASHRSLQVIACTGSVGKTTTTHLIAHLLKSLNYAPVMCGGNSGTPLLDLLKTASFFCVIELSSYQLEWSRAAYPHVVVFTPFYPNHLDRHKTVSSYLAAKCSILSSLNHQNSLVLDHSMWKHPLFTPYKENLLKKSVRFFITSLHLSQEEKANLITYGLTFLTVEQGGIYAYKKDWSLRITSLPSKKELLSVHPSCFLQACATLMALKGEIFISPLLLEGSTRAARKKIGTHRLEYLGTKNNISFYNDSKSTIIEATLAAVEQCAQLKKPIIVIVGGQSKGTAREDKIREISQHPSVKKIVSFSKEIKSPFVEITTSIEEALNIATNLLPEGGIVLFSPGGASFDTHLNFEHRGEHFISLVENKGIRETI